MERRSIGDQSLWRLSRKFRQGTWDESLVGLATSRINEATGSRERFRLLSICLATIPLQQVPGAITDTWTQELLERRWNSPDSHLAALLCTFLLASHPSESNKALRLANRLLKHPRMLRKYPLVLDLLGKQAVIPGSGKTVQGTLESSTNLYSRITSLNEFISANSIKSVSVVGNAPILLEHKHGKKIDSADCVIRFNHVVLEPGLKDSTGMRTSVWVSTPGFISSKNRHSGDTWASDSTKIWLSSYLPYKRPGKYWQKLATMVDTGFLESKHCHWLKLVQVCKAPPTAGLLALESLAATDCEISAFGFSAHNKFNKPGHCAGSPNHYGDSGRRSSRHNWHAEAEQLSELARHRIDLHL